MQNLSLSSDGSFLKSVSFPYRFILACIAGHVITTGGEFENFTKLAKLSGYPLAMLSSVSIALIVIEQVRYFNLVINKKFPDKGQWPVKIRWQIIMGLVLPFATVFVLAAVYYAWNGIFILDTLWPATNGWLIFFMLIVLNVLFSFTQPVADVPEKNEESQQMILDFTRAVVYIAHIDGMNKMHYAEGAYTMDVRSLNDIFKTLDPNLYIFTPRCSIIKRDNIKMIYQEEGGKLRVELFSPKGAFAIVSNRQRNGFKGYF